MSSTTPQPHHTSNRDVHQDQRVPSVSPVAPDTRRVRVRVRVGVMVRVKIGLGLRVRVRVRVTRNSAYHALVRWHLPQGRFGFGFGSGFGLGLGLGLGIGLGLGLRLG